MAHGLATFKLNACMHVISHAGSAQKILVDGKKNVVPEVWEVLDKIKAFSNKVHAIYIKVQMPVRNYKINIFVLPFIIASVCFDMILSFAHNVETAVSIMSLPSH